MSDLQSLEHELRSILGPASKFWPGSNAKLDDYYEVYLWAETVKVAIAEGWATTLVNAGPRDDEFIFRKGPGLINSGNYSYVKIEKGKKAGELHVGVRIKGASSILHEFDILGIDQGYRQSGATGQPTYSDVKLHIEAKFHASDLTLGIARSIVGLGTDCPGVEPFLVSKNTASRSVRPLIKHYGGHFVDRVFPGETGGAYFQTCVKAALMKW